MNTDYVAETAEGNGFANGPLFESSFSNLTISQIRSLNQTETSQPATGELGDILGDFSIQDPDSPANVGDLDLTTTAEPPRDPDRPRYPDEFDPIFTLDSEESTSENPAADVASNTRRDNGSGGASSERDALLERRLEIAGRTLRDNGNGEYLPERDAREDRLNA